MKAEKSKTYKALSSYLQKIIGEKLGKPPSNINTTLGFFDLGLDSKMAIELVRTLETKLGHELYPTLLFEYQNIEDLTNYLIETEGDSLSMSESSPPSKTNVSAEPSNKLPIFLPESTTKDDSGLELFQFGWKTKNIESNADSTKGEDLYLLADGPLQLADQLKDVLEQEVISIFSKNEIEFFDQVLDIIKTKLELRKTFNITILYNNADVLHYGFISGLLKTASLESPRIIAKTIGVNNLSFAAIDELSSIIKSEQKSNDREVRYVNGKREVKSILHLSWETGLEERRIKNGGVYLITGGTGGIAQLIANRISQTTNTTLILVGRSEKCRLSDQELKKWNAQYFACDVSNSDKVKKLIDQIIKSYGRLDGIIHSAGVIKDGFLIKKTKEFSDQVLSPKIQGAKALDQATKDIELDFTIYFSSMSAVTGNLGQGDYASANAWLDQYASYRNHLRKQGKRKGITLSINWPLWKEGGMQVDEETEKYLKLSMGMDLLPSEEGLMAFEKILKQEADQIMVLYRKEKEEEKEKSTALIQLKSEDSFEEQEVEEDIWGDEPYSLEGDANFSLPKEDAMAIIGLSGRYPDAKNLDEFWDNLKKGLDSICEIPKDRWDNSQYFDKKKGKTGKSYGKWGGFLDDVDKFDPLFFHMSPKTAENLDPQARLFLEESWKVLEDAGYNPEGISQNYSVGVFAGVFWTDYRFYRSENEQNSSSSFVSLVANITSFYLGLKGPSIGLDTQCSSSLTAIHLACDSIRRGECEMAIAGGVNLSLHPSKYTWLSNSMFLSDKGRCESFGEGGNGYVPAEGVGTVLIKKLSQAEKEGDRIYGIIKGSAINHGGKSGGFTVPNPNAQAEVIKDAIEKAGVRPEDFSYIEAHGTGTKLGDPIEIVGLKKAFDNTSVTGQFCALGSVKSNIGHGESAAGIAGLTKILLQLKYKQLVPSIHSATLNTKIDFEKTPFWVQQNLEDWVSPNNKLRLAGVSSFGAGGSNAHLIIEEYQTAKSNYIQDKPAIILLSAMNEKRLSEQIKNLNTFLKTKEDLNLYEIAYTLQTGRAAMEERVAFIAKDLQELQDQLAQYEKGDRQGILSGNIKKDQLDFILEGEAGSAYVSTALAKQQLNALGQLWVKGMELDWNLLYTENKRPSKISLPTYPFARERYWINSAKEEGGLLQSKLHPLLHVNCSDLQEQYFTSRFSGSESFLLDHQVKGDKVLPGVAYLEMAREAGFRSLKTKISTLKNIYWIQPLMVKQVPKELGIRIGVEGEHLKYEVYSREGDSEEVLHSQGDLGTEDLPPVPKYDVALLQSQLLNEMEGATCYELFRKRGLNYGSSFQRISKLYYNDSECLSELNVDWEAGYILPPGLLDSALQSIIGVGLSEENEKLWLPFSLRSMQLYDSLKEACWCYVRKKERGDGKEKLGTYDLEVLGGNGEVLLRIEDFVVLPAKVGKEIPSVTKVPSEESTLHLYESAWQSAVSPPSRRVENDNRLIVLAGASAALGEQIKEALEQEVLILEAQTELGYYKEVEQILVKLLKERKDLDLVLLYENEDYVNYGFISGLFKSAELEMNQFHAKTIGVEKLTINDLGIVLEIIKEEQSTGGKEIRYIGGVREEKRIEKLASPDWSSSKNWLKPDGVYLITGGTGGLGRLVAHEIAKTEGAQIILAGRSSKSKLSEEEMASIRSVYYSCDIGDKESLEALIGKIIKEHGQLDGIVHSAGVLRDNLLLKKEPSESQEVLLPKIYGAKNLDQATRNLDLDFMIYFSSVAGVRGNIGQSDYASANAWLDNYAKYREELRCTGKRSGLSVSINWPLWSEGGMRLEEEAQKQLKRSWGMEGLPTELGMEVLSGIGILEGSGVIVAYGQGSKLDQILMKKSQQEKVQVVPVLELGQEEEQDLKEAGIKYLKDLLSAEIKLPQGRIDPEEDLEIYGIDSIMITRLTNQLSEDFSEIPSTLFFEYRNLSGLASYLVNTYPEKLNLLAETNQSKRKVSPLNTGIIKRASLSKNLSKKLKQNKATSLFQSSKLESSVDVPIAIVGLSGRYPGSNNIKEFWEHLKNGKDLITEIPTDRWDLDKEYDPEKGKIGKSYSKWGGFIDDVDKFDPLFFNISPREAELMDPQERLFMQTAWECLEDAGYTKQRLNEVKSSKSTRGGSVGVYVGVMYEEYQLYGVEETLKGNPLAIGSSPASIANRVSYFLNIEGPSMAVDTMCSSSLTAIHLAVEAIRSGQCGMAIAGGVNVSVHPNKYRVLSQSRFVSDQGRCASFGEGGSGYVPSEGVGAVLLKPLHEAEEAGDQIYGLILGSSMNHGGKTNGYTVPNPNAQGAVIKEAFARAGVGAEQISYIEAHGTGTSLGDPIEIAGLNKAFGSTTKLGQYCSIGSVKSNMGHGESAAGISGLTKVLLQLKHKQLVPSLHSEELNAGINFSKTSFRVQQELSPWEVEDSQQRIAGISSFGAGGSNAHLVIQEYEEKALPVYESQDPKIIVLSAKTEEQLKEQVENLLAHLSKSEDQSLSDIAYTLQTGREAMEERLSLVVSELADLEEQLQGFLAGAQGEIKRGNTRKEKDGFVLQGKAGRAFIEEAIAHQELENLSQLWVKGVTIDWNLLYPSQQVPKRISLPSYPFAKNRYWIPKAEESILNIVPNRLHPLVHSNESDLEEQVFQSRFTGHEDFLSDHQVKKEKILPGVAYLELAREAGTRSMHQAITQIKEVSWIRPLAVNGQPKQVWISLFEEENEEIAYEVFSYSSEEAANSGDANVLHAQGKLSSEQLIQPNPIAVSEIKSRLEHQKDRINCYKQFQNIGLEYGNSFQGIEEIYFSETESLSKIKLLENEEYVLQPGILDSALQTCIGLSFIKGEENLSLPFLVNEVNIYGKVSDTRWCYARKSDSQKLDSKVLAYDIDMVSEQGEVLLNFKNVQVLPLAASTSSLAKNSKATPSTTSIYYKPVWQRTKLNEKPDAFSGSTLIYSDKTPFSEQLKFTLESFGNEVMISTDLEEFPSIIESVYFLQGLNEFDQQNNISQQIEEQEIAAFKCIKALQSRRIKELSITVLTFKTQAVHSSEKIQVAGAGMIGLFGSLEKEQTKWKLRIIDIDQKDQTTINDLLKVSYSSWGAFQILRDGSLYEAELIPFDHKTLPKGNSTLKQGGVYVILGGAGGLGKTTTEHLIKNYNAQVYWLGRRKKEEKIQKALDSCTSNGRSPIYIQCNANDPLSVESAYQQIKQREKEINGLFHSAIVLHDMLLNRMEEADFRKAFDPKSLSSHNFIDAFKAENLDFICFYSSMQSYLNAPGQSNYAAGCTYKDSFARSVEQQTGIKTFTVNWGYWGEVGVVSSAAYNKNMEQLGIASISKAEGMEALEILLSGETAQISVVKFTNAQQQKKFPVFAGSKMIIHQKSTSSLSLPNVSIPPPAIDPEKEASLQRICLMGIAKVLVTLGIEGNFDGDLVKFSRSLGVLKKYDRLFGELIRVLQENDYLRVENSTIAFSSEVKKSLLSFDIQQVIEEQISKDPDANSHYKLVKICLDSFEKILKGTVPATDVIFPDGRMDFVSDIYKNNELADYFNNAICQLVKSAIQERVNNFSEPTKITILEIGAGTGGTSKLLFEALADYKDHIRYLYTDISKSFLFYAEENYKGIAPYLETKLFDIQKSPQEQGVDLGTCDIVIGTNVVHATKNISQSLSNIKTVLKKEGLLLINEIAKTEIFTTLTFGLLDGWWLYEDKEIRLQGSPGLSEKNWEKIFEETGYVNFSKYPEEARLSQQIILGQSDGIATLLNHEIKAKLKTAKANAKGKDRMSPAKNPRIEFSSSKADSQEEKVASFVRTKLAKVLKMDPAKFDSTLPFSEYGIDSILGLSLMKEINESLQIDIPSTILFDYPTIIELSNYIQEEHSPKIPSNELGHSLVVVEENQLEQEEIANTQLSLDPPPNHTRPFRRKRKLKIPTTSTSIPSDFAIVAAAGRFASLNTADELWAHIEHGSRMELNPNGTPSSGMPYGKLLVEEQQNGLPVLNLDAVKLQKMSLQQRLIFEVLAEAMADYGQSKEELSSKATGVFICAQRVFEGLEKQSKGNNSLAYIIPNMLSFYLNLKGPSEVINTYCTSIYVAIHRAIQSISAGECEQAIIGGVNVISEAEMSLFAATEFGRLLSKNGSTKSFCDSGEGFVRSEGAGIIIIKSLALAKKEDQHILGIIKGSAVYHGGQGFSLEAPSAAGIKKVIETSLSNSGIDVDTIDYIEAHGIANPIADAIELGAINAAYKKYSKDPSKKWHIGSIKPTVGHSELASGMASLLKVLKAFQHKTIPGIPGLEKVNSELVPDHSLILNKVSNYWENGKHPRRAALNGYAVGGLNAHIVLEEYPHNDYSILPTVPKKEMVEPVKKVLTNTVLPLAQMVPDRPKKTVLVESDNPIYDVVVVGAGLSGLIAACYLAKQGKNVLVLEAHNIPGGYLQNYYRKGYNVDAVSAVVPDPHNTPIFKEVFRDLDLHQEWIPAPLSLNKIDASGNCISIDFEDTRVTGRPVKQIMISRFSEMLPEHEAAIKNLFDEMFDDDLYAREFAYYENLKLGDFLSKHLPVEVHHNFYNPFVNPTEVKSDTAYLPFKMFLTVQVATTQYYPKGSWKKLMNSLVEKLKEYGSQVKFKQRVQSFEATGKDVNVVITRRGRFETKSVLVCGSPYPLLTNIANPNPEVGAQYIKNLSERIPCAPSVVLTVFFTDSIFDKLTDQERKFLHGVVSFEDPKLRSFKGHFDTEQLYIVCPSSIDDTLNEKGDYFIATNTVKYIDKEFWKKNKKEVQLHFQKLFFAAFPSLEDTPCRFELATPLTMEKFTLNYKGAISGWAMTPDQIGENSLSHKTPWDNLFIAGHWAFPGPRIPWTMESAKSVVFEVERCLKKKAVAAPKVEKTSDRFTAIPKEQFVKFEELVMGILNISVEEIKPGKDFTDYDFGSIKLMHLIRSLNEEFDIDIRLGEVFQLSSVDKLIDLFIDKVKKKGTASKRMSKYIESFRGGDKGDIAIILPGLPGIVDGYYELANDLKEARVYGIHMPGFDSKEEPLSSIESLAFHYKEMISEIANNQPVNIYAHSFSGIILFELLKSFEIKTDRIVLIDCYAKVLKMTVVDQIATSLQMLIKQFELEKEDEEIMKYSTRLSKRPKKMRPSLIYKYLLENGADISEEFFSGIFSMVGASMGIKYKFSGKLDRQVFLIKAKTPIPGVHDELLGWASYYESIEVIDSQGDHFNMVKKQFVNEWLHELENYTTISL